MKRSGILTAILALAVGGCTSSTNTPAYNRVANPAIQTVIEKMPSELSIPHFSTMTLSGTALTLERVMETNDIYMKYAISYRSNGLNVTGVFLLPHGDGPYPLLVFNHGFIDPSIYTQGRGLKREEDYMARQGFAVLHTDYRGHAGSDPSPMQENVYDGNLEYAMDSANAILAARDAHLPTVDTRKIGMLGHSLGGGVTLAILSGKPELVTAAVLYAPVHSDVWENFKRWRAKRKEGDLTLERFGTPELHPETWANLSPLTFLDDITAPVLLFQGSSDMDVPKAWSDFLAAKLKENGKDVTYIQYQGEAHEFSFQWQDFMQRTSDFFRKQLVSAPLLAPLSPSRVTKKPFGLFVDPAHSPVSPEKFTGFHTGMDFETLGNETNVRIRSACSGKVIYKQHVGGYGGVLIQSCTYSGKPVTVLYGHLRLSSVKQRIGDSLDIGQPFALLGKGFSAETDGERQHLHLGIHRGEAIELKGYVNSEDQLDDWVGDIDFHARDL